MAGADVDPTTFASWQEAFQYPVASTRQFEKQLRNHAEANKQKLRTIVGASYRDLLGTADRIVDMDVQMKIVDHNIASMGQKTNAKAVDRIFDNCARFNARSNERLWDELSVASQVTILQRCTLLVARLIRRNESPLLSAKILVLSRLLHKVLSKTQSDLSLLQSLQQRLSSLRRRLLHSVDAKLANLESDTRSLVDNMCAFALTTSASPSDILRHFQQTRLQVIQKVLNEEAQAAQDSSKAIAVLLKTIKQTSQIFPTTLSDSLARLKERSLLQQKDILALEELELDIHGRWVAEELVNYTPWTRHDELQKPQTDKELKSWTRHAVQTFLKGLREKLVSQKNFEEVVATRRALFSALPWNSKSLPGVDLEEIVDELRKLFNERLMTIMTTSSRHLDLLMNDLPEKFAVGSSSAASIWTSALTTADVSQGARIFKVDLQRAYSGVDTVLDGILKQYDKWMAQLEQHMAALKAMKADRWESDVIDEDEDVDSDARRALLSEDDPRELEDAFSDELKKAFQSLQDTIQSTIEELMVSERDLRGDVAVGLLRIVREMSQRSIGEDYGRKLQFSPQFSASMVEPLQQQLVNEATNISLERLEGRLQAFVESTTLPARSLWEGNPALPVQPSTFSFRFLNELVKAMAVRGQDLWSGGMVQVLKDSVFDKVTPMFEAALEDIERLSATNGANGHDGDEKEESDTTNRHDEDEKEQSDTTNGMSVDSKNKEQSLADEKRLILLFDVLYLLRALDNMNKEQPGRQESIVSSAFSSIEDAAYQRLKRSAAEYWKRTYLMHALLAE